MSDDKFCYSEGNFYRKSVLVLLEWTPRLCLRFVLYDIRLFNTFIIAMYGVMNNSLLMPNLVAFYAELNKIQKMTFILRSKFLSVYSYPIQSNIQDQISSDFQASSLI